MASSDVPLKIPKDDEQVPVGFRPFKPVQGTGSEPDNCPKDPKLDTKNGQTVESMPPTTPENNTVTANKRKRESVAASAANNDDKKTKSADVTPFANTTETSEKHVATIETTGAKEAGMKDAETVYTKEVEMQDAECVYSKTSVEEKSIEESTVVNEEEEKQPNTNKNDMGSNSSTIEQPAKVNEFEGSEKESIDANTNDGSGQQVLGEVATLLKQVQESDAKAKLEVEVKVKKMDHGDVMENGETNETQAVDRVTHP